MQKVEGSNPFSRSQKARICRPFCVQSACASASGRTDSDSPRGDRRPFQKTPCLQVDSGSSEPKSFCGPAEGRAFCCGRWPPVPANGTFLRTDACRRAASDPDFRGRRSISVRIREVDLGPHRDLGEPWAPGRALGGRRRGCCAVPVTGGLGRRNRSRSIAEAVAYMACGSV